jgi:type IV secretory pathway TrbD component
LGAGGRGRAGDTGGLRRSVLTGWRRNSVVWVLHLSLTREALLLGAARKLLVACNEAGARVIIGCMVWIDAQLGRWDAAAWKRAGGECLPVSPGKEVFVQINAAWFGKR